MLLGCCSASLLAPEWRAEIQFVWVEETGPPFSYSFFVLWSQVLPGPCFVPKSEGTRVQGSTGPSQHPPRLRVNMFVGICPASTGNEDERGLLVTLHMRSHVAVGRGGTTCVLQYAIVRSEVTLAVSCVQWPKVHTVKGSRVGRVQRSKHRPDIQQRVHACAPLPPWQQERREEASGRANNEDGEAGEGPCEIVSGE